MRGVSSVTQVLSTWVGDWSGQWAWWPQCVSGWWVMISGAVNSRHECYEGLMICGDRGYQVWWVVVTSPQIVTVTIITRLPVIQNSVKWLRCSVPRTQARPGNLLYATIWRWLNSFDVCRYYQQESDMIWNIFVLLTFTYCSEALKCIICVSV